MHFRPERTLLIEQYSVFVVTSLNKSVTVNQLKSFWLMIAVFSGVAFYSVALPIIVN